jgi:CRISPR-associated protein Csx17
MEEAPIAAVPALSPGWVIAADDGSAAFRLAVALASQYGQDLGSIRTHCVPRTPRRSARYGGRFHITAQGAFGGRDLVWTGRDPIADLGALAWRRLLRSRKENLGGFELRGRLMARLGDLHDFLAGALDDARMAALARGLMAVRWNDTRAHRITLRGTDAEDVCTPWPLYALFRRLYRPGRPGAVDPEPLYALLGGDLVEAVRLASRRMAQTRIWPDIVRGIADAPPMARRLAASLCFPIDSQAWSTE